MNSSDSSSNITKVTYSQTVKEMIRDSKGKFVKKVKVAKKPVTKSVAKEKVTITSDVPPLVSFEVTNPVTYLKIWWKKVMSGEGVDFRFRIHPLTAITLAIVFTIGGAGVGWISNSKLHEVPVIREFILAPSPTQMPTPTLDPWRETAFTGVLKQASNGFYLVTSDAEAITLQIPDNVNLTKYLGKRILAIGSFNKQDGVLRVREATDMEVLIQSSAIVTIAPSVTPVGVEPSL